MKLFEKILLGKLENIILVITLVMGLSYIYISPPFQVPDSPNHFFRTYQLASGQVIPSNDNNSVGGWVPSSFNELQATFTPYRYNSYHKMECAILDSAKLIELNESDQVYMHFPNTGVYSPISYIPQVIAMRIGLWLNLKPITIYYLVRFFAFFFWFGMMVLTFRFLPIKKILFGVLVLLPMSLFINTSFSADMMINGLSWLYLAVILNIALTKKELSTKYLLLLIGLIMLIGLSKLVYIPIVAVLLIIPYQKFKTKLRMAGFIAVSMILGFGSASLWKGNIDSFYTSYLDYNPEFRDNITLGHKADMNLQMDHIKANKWETVKVFAQSYFREFDKMTTGYIGNLGWNRFRMPFWFILFGYAIILFFAFSHNSDEYFLSIKQKIILVGVVGACTLLVMLSQYLTWNPVGYHEVWPLMGRYFTPIYPMLFLALTIRKFKVSKKLSILIFAGYGMLATAYTGYKMIDSFYVNAELELVWEEDFSDKSQEYLRNEHSFEFGKINGNSNVFQVPPLSILIPKGLILSSENPYGYTVTINNVKKGDKIVIEAWRDREEASIVFDDLPHSQYFTTTCHSTKIIKNGFELIQETYFCKQDFEGLKVYLYDPSGSNSHVKDFSVQYFKSK